VVAINYIECCFASSRGAINKRSGVRRCNWLRVAEAARVVAPKSLMVPLLAQKAGLDDKVKALALYVEPITDMIDRSLKADAH
jgi:hypothetical protein